LGGAGNDRMAGNGGRNRLSGGRGNDRINSVNGRRDTVKCGRGGRDRARVDRSDRTRGCERVIRAR
jgi:Ca2+-binding RTX toxin-like protein